MSLFQCVACAGMGRVSLEGVKPVVVCKVCAGLGLVVDKRRTQDHIKAVIIRIGEQIPLLDDES